MNPTDELTLFITLRNPPHGGAVIVDMRNGTDEWGTSYHSECVDDTSLSTIRTWISQIGAEPYLTVVKDRTSGREGMRYRTCARCAGRLQLDPNTVEVLRMRKGLPV